MSGRDWLVNTSYNLSGLPLFQPSGNYCTDALICLSCSFLSPSVRREIKGLSELLFVDDVVVLVVTFLTFQFFKRF